MQETFDEQVYNTLNGFYLSEWCVPGVENAFAQDQPCLQLYTEALNAYNRLCDRLGVKDEDEDIEIIFNAFLQIAKILGLKMFHYGATLQPADIQDTPAFELPKAE